MSKPNKGNAGDSSDTSKLLSRFIALEKEVWAAKNKAQFSFAVCNSTYQLIHYQRAIFWCYTKTKKIQIRGISGVADVNNDAPFVAWLKRGLKCRLAQRNASEAGTFTAEDLRPRLSTEWEQWLPPSVLWQPMVGRQGEVLGGLLIHRDTAWTDRETVILDHLVKSYAYAWFALTHTKRKRAVVSPTQQRKRKFYAAATVLLASFGLLLPVSQTTLAPAEIVALNPIKVTAPQTGVISTVHINPNQTVKKNQALFSLNDADMRARYEVAEKDYEVSAEKYRKVVQHSFRHAESKAKIQILHTQMQKSEAEYLYLKDKLNKIKVAADMKGVAIFPDKNSLIGKPVSTGEQVMEIADPHKKSLEIWVPANDAITLSVGSKVKLFLNVDPLHTFDATVTYVSYSAIKRPNGVLAYQVKATFNTQRPIPRIGLLGTAKLYASKIPMGYYLFWRPVSALRRTIGL